MVAFKSADGEFSGTALQVPLIFGRRVCLSLGKSTTREGVDELVRLALGDVRFQRLRVEERRWSVESDECSGGLREGEPVATVVALGPEEYWAGVHWHRAGQSPDPGGIFGLEMPADSPSRAWLKLEEAVKVFGLQFRRGDVAVELGCAPGGVILALLRRGVPVIGVDPARLAEVVMHHALPTVPSIDPAGDPWVVHCRKPAALVSKRDLAGRATWFLSDMNQSPAVAIAECRRFAGMCPSIHAALITLKLTDLAEATAAGAWLEAMRGIGFRDVAVRQLSVHHRELVLLGTGRRVG
jgi:23S rRNA (cytidine2498-2'-O)-methyltransferase